MNYNDKLHQIRSHQRGKWDERILSQMAYLQKLYVVEKREPDALFEQEIETLYRTYKENGALTKEDCLRCEKNLQPLSAWAKSYTLHMVAHAHIDMNWQWDFSETVSTVVDTFRTMLDLIREFPQFIFSQSQASTYKIIEDYAPWMLDEIAQRIHEGRWEVTASSWVEADQNMPSAESDCRHILYTKDYIKRTFGIPEDELTIDFEPDTFGHHVNLPELLNAGGVKYMYFGRGYATKEYLFRYQAPSGKSVLAYEDPFFYLSLVSPEIFTDALDICGHTGFKRALRLYGVGDHGGGPSRRDILRLTEYCTWPLAPTIVFGTLRSFFETVEQEYHDRIPVLDHEMNYVFQGCYTSQSRIKMANRIGEQRLYDAETLCALSRTVGSEAYPMEKLKDAWERVLFNQFHDILPGSCVIDTREHAMGRFQEAVSYANVAAQNAMRCIAEKIDTSDIELYPDDELFSVGAAPGARLNTYGISMAERGSGRVRIYHLFNTTSQPKTGVQQLNIWAWPYDLANLQVYASDGTLLEHSATPPSPHPFWENQFKLFVKVTVPPMGYETIIMRDCDSGNVEIRNVALDCKREIIPQNVLENSKLKAVFDEKTMQLISLYDKKSGKELVHQPTAHLVYTLEQDAGMSAWRLGRTAAKQILNETQEIKIINRTGGLRQSIRYELNFNNSIIRVDVQLDHDSDVLRFETEFEWLEVGHRGQFIPRLDFVWNTPFQKVMRNIPSGIFEHEPIREDVPASSFIAAGGMMLFADNKYGFRAYNDEMSVCLVRSSYDPDPYPETCIHKTCISLLSVQEENHAELIAREHDLNNPVQYISETSRTGRLPKKNSLITAQGDAALAALKPAEDGNGIIIRIYAVGEGGIFTLCTPYNRACYTDICERNLSPIAVESDGTVSAKISKGEIKTIHLFNEA